MRNSRYTSQPIHCNRLLDAGKCLTFTGCRTVLLQQVSYPFQILKFQNFPGPLPWPFNIFHYLNLSFYFKKMWTTFTLWPTKMKTKTKQHLQNILCTNLNFIFYDFPWQTLKCPRLFTGLFAPGKWNPKIPWLSRIYMICMNLYDISWHTLLFRSSISSRLVWLPSSCSMR